MLIWGLHEMKLALGLAPQAASPSHLVTLPCRYVADIFGLNTVTVQAYCFLDDYRWIRDRESQLAWIREVEAVGIDVERTNNNERWRIRGLVDVERHGNAFVVIAGAVRHGNPVISMASPDERLDYRSVGRRLAWLIWSTHLIIAWGILDLQKIDRDCIDVASLLSASDCQLGK